MDRRLFLKAGCVSVVGSFLANSKLFAETQSISKQIAKHIIYITMHGGMSHIDSFDPKPGASTQGEFKAIEANNGKLISEKLPLLSQMMNKICLINSMTSKEGSHERGQYVLHTSYPPLSTLIHPTMGSWVSKFSDKEENVILPKFITIGNSTYSSGFLGSNHEPLKINKPQKGLNNVKLPPQITKERFDQRMNLLNELDQNFRTKYKNDKTVNAYNDFYNDAVNIMFSKDVKAFDIESEPKELVELYGNDDFGQGCLLGRRLIQHGVRYVEIGMGGFDTHDNNFERLDNLLGKLDKSVTALILDLEQKGLIDKTLIVLGTEFGRTPKINNRDGRDHYPKAFSMFLAGAGVKKGMVYGKTDNEGKAVIENPVSFQDINATIAHLSGIDPTKEVYSDVGRPFTMGNKGKVLKECLL